MYIKDIMKIIFLNNYIFEYYIKNISTSLLSPKTEICVLHNKLHRIP